MTSTAIVANVATMYTRPDPKPTKREKKIYAGMRRKGRLRARGKTAHARRARDFDYLAKVAKLPCFLIVIGSRDCEGRIEVDHAFGRRRKDSDREGIPLCAKHHREKTGQVGGGGFMAGWSVALRRAWLAAAVAATQATILTQPTNRGSDNNGQ